MESRKLVYRVFCILLSTVLVLTSFTPSFTFDQVMAEESEKIINDEKLNNGETKQEAILNQDTDSLAELGITEMPDLRDEMTKVFIDEEGSYFAEVYLEPIHYEEDGEWKEIKNELVTSKDGKFIKNQQNAFSVKFPKDRNGKKKNELFNYKIKKHEMTVNLVTEQNETNTLDDVSLASPTLQDGLVIYDDIHKDINFEYAVEGSTVKENIVLDSYQGVNTFQFELDVKDLHAIQQDDGSIHFLDKNNKFVFLIERPYMFDSNRAIGEEGAISHEITQEIEKTDTGYLLTLTASEDYLTDSARVYPVTIDPWIDVYQAEDTFVASNTSYNYHNTDYLFVGNHSTIGKTRSLLKFTLPTIPNGKVTGATLSLYQSTTSNTTPINVHALTSTFSSKSVTWASQPKFNTAVSATNNSSSVGYIKFNVSDLVKSWYENPTSNFGMMLKYPDGNEATVNRKSLYSTELLTEDGDLFGKPKLLVEFRPVELLGLADYWTYTSDIFQGEGTGVVNVINGNMVYDISLLNIGSKVSAFDLDLTYNSRSNYNTYYGLGWMFSPHESILKNTDKSVIEYRAPGGVRYHFTKPKQDNSETYTSPEGVEYTLTTTSSGFELKDTSETIRYFDTRGRLYELKDEKGNRIIYTFENDTSNRVVKIVEKTGTNGSERVLSLQYNTEGYLWIITDFKGQVVELQYEQINNTNHLKSITYAKGSAKNEKIVTFSYTSGTPARLAAVTDANGNTGEIKYNANNQVIKMVDPRDTNTFVSLEYQNQYTIYTDSRNNKVKYEYSPIDKPTVNVTKIIENYGKGEEESTIEYTWAKNLLQEEKEPDKDTGIAKDVTTSATYDDKGNLKKEETTGGVSITQEFDDKNNVTSYKDSSGVTEKNIYDVYSNLITSTSNFGLSDYNQYDSFGNLTRSVSSTRSNYNRLTNAQFELSDTSNYATDWKRYTATNAGDYEQSSTSYTGDFSSKITLSGVANAGYYTQRFATISSDTRKTYTVAAQVKTENAEGDGASIRIYPLDANQSNIRDSEGKTISYVTSSLKGTTDWTRLSDTFVLPENTANVRVDLLFKGSGSAYFDDAQVTYGTTLNQFATNENSSFEIGTDALATEWTLNALGSGDGRNSDKRYAGQYSMKLTGTASATRYAGQLVKIKGKKGDKITLSGWGNANNTSTSGTFSLSILLTNTSGVSKTYDIPFMKGTHIANTWQYAKDTVTAEEDYVSAKVYVKYGKQAGTAYFDNIKVEQNGSAVAKSYSTDGNKLLSETDAFGNTTSYTYDANGNELKVTDPTGLTKSRIYNDLDLVESVTLGTGSNTLTSSYSFDKQGNITERKNPLGFKTTYKFNEINMVAQETDALGKYIKYNYDGETNLTHVTRGDGATSSIIEMQYDNKNNEKAKYVNNSLIYKKSYFKNGLLKTIQVNGETGSYVYDYDDSQRLTTAITSDKYQLKNVYETKDNVANGLRTSFTETVNNQNYTTNYTFDGLQRLTNITTPSGNEYNYYYNETSQPVRLKSTNSTQTMDFDEDGQLLKQSVFAKDFLQLRYQYAANGNLSSYYDGTKKHAYTYDFAGRLQTWNNGKNTVTYQYDKVGNVLNPSGKTYTFNGANEITAFTYDFAGNLTKDNRLNYTWDGLDQLTATSDITGSTNKVTYTYYPDGLRKTKTVGNTTYKYYYDGSDLVRVTDASQNTIWAITWNNGKVVSLTNAAGETFEYVTNYRGDVVRILDANGATVATYDYDPWGNQLSTEPTDSRIQGQPIRYAGYVYDSETKLYYLQARYYDPQTARFISRDPDPGDEDDPTTMNGYTYADDNPVMNRDPDGHWAWAVVNAGFAVYDGYKAYKAGKNKKQIAWAVASSFVGLGHVKKAGKVLKAVNGNSKKSTRVQHGYVITDRKAGKIVKVGVSGGKLNKNGTSRRANSQVNKWGKDRFKARVITKNVKGRAAILEWERNTAAKLRNKGRLRDTRYHSRP